MIAVLGEDETLHMLTRVYYKCLDLKTEKGNLITKQTVLRDFLFQIWTLHVELIIYCTL